MSKYQGLEYIADGAEVYESPDIAGKGDGLAVSVQTAQN